MRTPGTLRSTFRAMLLSLAVASLWPHGAVAQEGVVLGRVVDSTTQTPIPYALITVTDETGREVATALTNSDGRYVAVVAVGSYQITVSAIGYGTQAIGSAQVGTTGAATANGSIARQALELSPLVVSVGRQPEKAITAPAHVEVVSEEAIRSRPTTTPVDHLRSVPGVDVITQGLQSTNVVVRGFNNIFSGSLHTLTDNRIAGVPSLRVNVMNFVPTTNEDIERIEIVLGPGSALYGPNTADGVMHMITRSPLTSTGSSVSVMGGQQGVFGAAFRTAHMVRPGLGVKLSGQFFQGDEWAYQDPVELGEQAKFAGNLAFWRNDMMNAVGISQAEADARIARIAARDYSIERWSGEARADWAITENTTAVLTAGISQAGNQIELTGLGAGQVQDWRYTFYQGRLTRDRFFGQIYLNKSDAGSTFLLRNGAPIEDKSTLLVAQMQHGASLGTRLDFTYGTDFIWTNPLTNGTINGAYEYADETTEVGVYVQGEAELTPTLDLVLAGRIDSHSALPDPVFSPRAALVWEPSPGHVLRTTVNRAFSTPSSLNQFLDLGTAMPLDLLSLGQLGYSVRVQGTGEAGFGFEQGDGSYLMRSPFTPIGLGGPAQLVPASIAANYWLAAVTAGAAGAAAAGTPIPAPMVAYLQGLASGPNAPTTTQITSNFLVENPAGGFTPVDLTALDIPDIAPIRESTQTTFELGYKGLLSDRVLLAADTWFTRRYGFVTPLTVQTPFITLDGGEIGAYLVPRFMADLGMDLATAMLTAAQVTPAIAAVPVGVISSADVNANGAQALATYTNVNENIDLYGLDVAATVLLTEVWSVSGSASFVNDETFTTDRGQVVVLNAPKTKGTLGVAYRDQAMGVDAEFRGRFSGTFPAASGVYEGSVEESAIFDLNVSYRLPMNAATTVQLGIQNLFDSSYTSFPGTPAVGMMGLLRVRYEF